MYRLCATLVLLDTSLQAFITPALTDSQRFLTAIGVVLSRTTDLGEALQPGFTSLAAFQSSAPRQALPVDMASFPGPEETLSSDREDVDPSQVWTDMKLAGADAMVADDAMFLVHLAGTKFLQRM